MRLQIENQHTKAESNTLPGRPDDEWDFSTIVAVTSSLGLGATLALSQALCINKSEVSFRLSIWTGIAFLSGFNLAFAYLQFLFTLGDRTPRLFRQGGLAMLIVMTAGALIYPLRFFPMNVLVDRFGALGAALCFIAAGLTLLWRVVLAARIEEDEQEGKERHPTRVDSRAQESPAFIAKRSGFKPER